MNGLTPKTPTTNPLFYGDTLDVRAAYSLPAYDQRLVVLEDQARRGLGSPDRHSQGGHASVFALAKSNSMLLESDLVRGLAYRWRPNRETRGMRKTPTINTLFYGDNLDILRKHIAGESIEP